MDNATAKKNKTILINRPNSDQVMLVICVILDPASLDVEGLLAGIVPEMAKGAVRGGMLVVGESVLLLRNTGVEVKVDEADTNELLALAGLEGPYHGEAIVDALLQWITIMGQSWRDRLMGRLRELLVPYLVAGLAGDVELSDGAWGITSHRVASEE